VLEFGVPEVNDYVATHASALKAHRQSIKNREHNRQFRSRLRGALKSIRAAIDSNDLAAAKSALKETISLIDKMASKGIIHRNAASRYKSRLHTRIAARSKAA
jgi:small subunit ribosomal protein S20